ncbi:hypothetical protein CRE_23011 [Caenorhabditis remanei]|uniref:Uncharacterized protein n=1 Tax=Caenorhabditis remanei TaxID=31234 RepID=E3N4G8_CAERE|nr:hypothetical protein CRE_23011 [Caenorhabditis remanei]
MIKNEDSSLQDSSNIMKSPPKPAVDKDLMQKEQVARELIALCEKVMNVRNNSDEFIAFVKEQKNMAAPLKKRGRPPLSEGGAAKRVKAAKSLRKFQRYARNVPRQRKIRGRLELSVKQSTSPAEPKEILASMFPFVKFEKQSISFTNPEIKEIRALNVSSPREVISSSSSSSSSSNSVSMDWARWNQMVPQVLGNELEAAYSSSNASCFYQAETEIEERRIENWDFSFKFFLFQQRVHTERDHHHLFLLLVPDRRTGPWRTRYCLTCTGMSKDVPQMLQTSTKRTQVFGTQSTFFGKSLRLKPHPGHKQNFSQRLFKIFFAEFMMINLTWLQNCNLYRLRLNRNVEGLPDKLCLLCQGYQVFKNRKRPAENVVTNDDDLDYLKKWDVYEKKLQLPNIEGGFRQSTKFF